MTTDNTIIYETINNNQKDVIISYDYLKKHVHPPIYLWSYRNGEIYKLSRKKPVFKYRSFKPGSWKKLDYQPYGVKIHMKTMPNKKKFWLTGKKL